MTAPHDAHAAEHDDLLHTHLSGDVPADDARLIERLSQCAACRERLDELRSLTDLLERVGDEQRRSLTPTPTPAPGAGQVAATLAALARGRAPAALRPVPVLGRRATLWRVGLAAASVVAAGWIVKTLLPRDAQPREDVLLGDREDTRVTPSGTVEAFTSFDWVGAPEGAASFKVRIWSEGQSLSDEPIEKSVDRLPWNPLPTELEALPRAIQWELVAYDRQGGFLQSSGLVGARLSGSGSR
jgi:hypothetical protein